MEIYWTCLLFWVGVSVGSFINMLLYRTELKYQLRKKDGLPRLPAGKAGHFVPRNDVGGRSYCDFCGEQLRWSENIPIVSWVMLKGRSRCCNKKLPYQYPLLELSVGAVFALMSGQIFTDNWLTFVLKLVITSLLFFSAIFDFKHMILPDFSTYTLMGSAALLWVTNNYGEMAFIYAGLGAFLFLLILHLITKGKGMGMGDVKYVIFMGLLLGVAKTILAFYLAFIGGAVVGICMIFFLKKKKNSRMPFGPFLITATFVSWFWGEKLLLYFYRWF